MAIPQRIALTLPDPRGVKATIEIAKWAEAAGYDDLWFADATSVDALTTAAAVALNTARCRIGTAIIPVFSRTPAVLASTAQVLNQLSDGRFILGLGSSSQTMMENWHGLTFAKPLTRVTETVQLIKQILLGEKTDFQGETVRSKGYRQMAVAPGAQPIYMAALRARMLEAAAEFSDGVILNLFPKDALPSMIEHIKIGAERGGKKLADIEIVCRHQIVVTEDKAQARNLIRAGFAPYYATSVYNAFLAWAGYADVAKEISAGWAAKDRHRTTRALGDQMVDDIAILGSAAECHERIREYAAMGITTHIVSCVSPTETKATFDAFTAKNFSF